MDEIVFKSKNEINFDSALEKLSNKIRSDYPEYIKTALVSSEQTTHEGFLTTFLIFKVESIYKFGYYYFYDNNETKKILLVSEFGIIKDKR